MALSDKAQLQKSVAFSELNGESVSFSGTVGEVRIMDKSVRIRLDSQNGGVHAYFDDHPGLAVGDEIGLSGDFRTLRGPRNPGEFDFRSYYHRRGVWGNVYSPRLTAFEPASTWRPDAFVSIARGGLNDLFREKVGGDAGALMSALIVGLREEIPEEVRQDFADTGVIHVLAVSGLHVGYVLLIIMAVMKIVRLPYRWQKWAVIACLVLYAVLTGGKPSVWRATLMVSLYLVAKIVQRDANLWNIIAAAGLTLLLIDPLYLFDLGFRLSFAAVISIVFFYRFFEDSLPERLRPANMENRLLKGASGLLLVSLSAQIGTLPFIWAFFGKVPVIGVLANVLIVPLVGVVVSIGFAILFLGWIPVVGEAFGHSAWLLSETIFALAQGFASVPFSSIQAGQPEPVQLLQYGAVVAALVMFLRRALWRRAAFAAVVAANLFIWPWAVEWKVMDVIFLDVGQGDGAVLRIPTEGGMKTILVDAGPLTFNRDAGEKVTVPVLQHIRVDTVDLLIMSHPHADHIGGVPAVMGNIPVKEVWDTFSQYESSLYRRVMDGVEERGVAYFKAGAGYESHQFSPAGLTILHPDSTWAVHQRNVNNASVVVKLTYGETSFLFVGDLEREGDREISRYGDILDADILKVGHHGSITSTTPAFLSAVTPQFAVISVGERNKFGHPSGEVIERLEGTGTEVLRTDREGAIWLKTDGRIIWRHEWRPRKKR